MPYRARVISIRRMVLADVEAVSRAQARAFVDDPLQVWTYPDDATRADRLEQMFRFGLPAMSMRHDEAYVDDSCVVAALWMPPGTWNQPLPPDAITTLEPLLEVLGRDAIDRQRRANDAMARVHPRAPHWYLQGLGTDPVCQGRGYATAALAPVLARADAAGQAAYLESTKPQNVPFYEHRGFRVTGTIEIPAGGPTLYAMWRDPVTPAGSRV